jgi:hypothetical protein
MGAAASWLSVSGLSKAEVLDRLGLAETLEPVPDGFFPRGAKICVSELPSGRILVLSGNLEHFGPTRHHVASIGCEFVGGQIEEHVMYACGWQCRDGKLVWSLASDSDDEAPAIIGELPAEVSRALAADESDAFEVALDAVAEIGRFKVGEDMDGWSWDVVLVRDAEEVRRLQQFRAESAIREATRAESAAAWKASGGFAGAIKRMFGRH